LLAGRAIGSTKQVVEPDDVLICKINPRINRVWKVMPKTDKRQIASSEWIVMRANGMNSEFLRTYFCSQEFREILCEDLTGVGGSLTRAQPKRVAKFRVPLAPLAEQKRIADKLEAVLGRVDACRARLDRVPDLLKRFRQSVLAAATSGQLTEDWREPSRGKHVVNDLPEGFPDIDALWHWQRLEDLCDHVVDCPHSTPSWTETGRLCVRTTNFRPGRLDLSQRQYVSDETFQARIERLKPEPGDILYSREGGILGIACMIPPGVDLCLGQRMMLFRTSTRYESALLMHWLNSPFVLQRVRELTGGSASPHLNVRDIRALPVPVPPLAEQAEIVRRVEALFALADRIEARLATAQRLVERLTPATLSKAFRGDLVPQDPNDEPASKLLEHLPAASRNAANLTKRR
jgi:type I restriction enzyme S subunit